MISKSDQTYTFHVNGMHCKACVLLTESELLEVPGVSRAISTLETTSVEIVGNFGDKSAEEIAALLSEPMKKHGYSLSVEKKNKVVNWGDFKFAIPIALLFAVFFVLLQKMGIVNLVDASSVSFGTAFFVGIIASLSTCMAVVGGLVLSMSATFAKSGDRFKPQFLFHGGRLISFFIFGGVIGLIGSAFTLSSTATFVLNVVIGIVMIILGINLLDIFSSTKKLSIGMPKFVSRHALGITKLNHSATPILVGIATFFLPCGFTQAMQVYTLGTGSFLTGALTMFSFALGTLPILALVSFSSFSMKESTKAGIFFKTAGLIVIMFALFNIVNGLVVVGFISPVFNF